MLYNKFTFNLHYFKLNNVIIQNLDFKGVITSGTGCPNCATSGFNKSKSAILYYLKITTEDNKVLYKIGITNRTVKERFNLTDLSKIEIIKLEEFKLGSDALNKETEIKRKFKEFQYKGPKVLSSGNTELFTKDIMV